MIAPTILPNTNSYQIALRSETTAVYRRALRHEVSRALEAGERRIVVDCREWDELDLILLSSLITCASNCDVQGAEFEVINLSADLQARIESLHVASRIGLAAHAGA